MKYLFCYDIHNSEENRDNYGEMMDIMNRKFGPMIQFTESVYLFETNPIDLGDLRQEIKKATDFIPDLEFYVFQLADEMDMVTTLVYCEKMVEYYEKERERLFAELGGR